MRLSVIMPIYNSEKYLKPMIDSILAQNFTDYELLLIDDGSTDGSGKICDAYAAKDSRVQVFHIKNNGVSNARNFGITKACGEYIHFVDSDDILKQGMYQEFAQVAERENSDIIACASEQINEKMKTAKIVGGGKNQTLHNRKEIAEYLDGIEDFPMRFVIHYVWNKWYKRSTIMNHKVEFPTVLSLGEDYVFNCRLIKFIHTFSIVETPYYEYYIRGSSLVSAFQSEPWKSRQILLDAHKELYQSYGIWEKNEKKILFEEGKMCFVALRSVNSERCKLNREQKQLFLKKMRESYQMELIGQYLKNSKKPLHKIWYFLMKMFGILGINMVLYFDRLQRKWKNK